MDNQKQFSTYPCELQSSDTNCKKYHLNCLCGAFNLGIPHPLSFLLSITRHCTGYMIICRHFSSMFISQYSIKCNKYFLILKTQEKMKTLN